MDIGFGIGCNLTVMTEFYEHGIATKFKANRFNRSSTVGLAQHLSNASRRRDKQKPRWQAESLVITEPENVIVPFQKHRKSGFGALC